MNSRQFLSACNVCNWILIILGETGSTYLLPGWFIYLYTLPIHSLTWHRGLLITNWLRLHWNQWEKTEWKPCKNNLSSFHISCSSRSHNSWNRRKWDEPVVTMNGKIQWIGSDCIVSYNKHIWRSPLSPFQYFVGQTIIKKRRGIKITTDCSSPFHGRCVKCVPSTVLNCCCRLSLFLTVPLSPRNKFGKIVPCALTRGTLGSKECMFWCLSQAPW